MPFGASMIAALAGAVTLALPALAAQREHPVFERFRRSCADKDGTASLHALPSSGATILELDAPATVTLESATWSSQNAFVQRDGRAPHTLLSGGQYTFTTDTVRLTFPPARRTQAVAICLMIQ